jgi:hypothetical protein
VPIFLDGVPTTFHTTLSRPGPLDFDLRGRHSGFTSSYEPNTMERGEPRLAAPRSLRGDVRVYRRRLRPLRNVVETS